MINTDIHPEKLARQEDTQNMHAYVDTQLHGFREVIEQMVNHLTSSEPMKNPKEKSDHPNHQQSHRFPYHCLTMELPKFPAPMFYPFIQSANYLSLFYKTTPRNSSHS